MCVSAIRMCAAAAAAAVALTHSSYFTRNTLKSGGPLGAEENNVIHRTLTAACKDNFMVGEDNLFATQFAVGLFYPLPRAPLNFSSRTLICIDHPTGRKTSGAGDRPLVSSLSSARNQ